MLWVRVVLHPTLEQRLCERTSILVGVSTLFFCPSSPWGIATSRKSKSARKACRVEVSSNKSLNTYSAFPSVFKYRQFTHKIKMDVRRREAETSRKFSFFLSFQLESSSHKEIPSTQPRTKVSLIIHLKSSELSPDIWNVVPQNLCLFYFEAVTYLNVHVGVDSFVHHILVAFGCC